MKKLFVSSLLCLLTITPLFAQTALKATLEEGNYQIQRDGKRIIDPQGTTDLKLGDFITLGEKAKLTIAMADGASISLGGSSVALVNPWQGEKEGQLTLIYGQAVATTTTDGAAINSPLGEVNLDEESEAYIAVAKQTLGVSVTKGEAELTDQFGDDQDIEIGEIAVASDEIRHRQIPENGFDPKDATQNSPNWSKSPITLWPVGKLGKMELVEIEKLTGLSQQRKSLNLNLSQNKLFVPTKIEAGEVVAGKQLDDGPTLFKLNSEDYKSRRIGDVMEIQITFEK